ncbi:hypothetical protein F5146DRAFT_1121769 [Armillaria mellea]|nr:hypothetical protein F5146DRAFT_1121769 [Armillaria mellea]
MPLLLNVILPRLLSVVTFLCFSMFEELIRDLTFPLLKTLYDGVIGPFREAKEPPEFLPIVESQLGKGIVYVFSLGAVEGMSDDVVDCTQRTRSSTSKRSTEQPQQHHCSLSPDTVPTTPPNRSAASDDVIDELDLSDDEDDEDDMLPVHRASQPQTPQNAASKDKGKAKAQSTPYVRGSASHSVVELQTQDDQNHKFDEADAFLKDDLRHRIFIKFETFLVKVLHLPTDWRVSLKSEIATVQKDETFRTLFLDYLRLCDVVGTGIEKERELYRSHVDLCNHVIDALQRLPNLHVDEDKLIQFNRIDPYPVRGSTVKPDMVGMLRVLSNSAEVVEVKEVKGADDAIVEGYDAIRLKTKDHLDPLTPRPKKNRTYLKDKGNVVDVSCPQPAPEVEASQASSRGQKRKAEAGNEASSSKMSRLSKIVSSKGKVGSGRKKVLDEEGFAPGTDSAEKARIQCARYTLHILSNAVLRSHALVTLIDRDRIQLSYYGRSAIIVSQAIGLGNADDEVLFIAMLIGSHRLTLEQRGILQDIIKDPYVTDFGRFNTVSKDAKLLFSGLEMTLQKDGKDIELTLGDMVYRQRGLFGRDTCVVRVTCTWLEWEGKKLVVKISWPNTLRKSEKELLDIAIAKANEMAEPDKTHWILNHLPNILHEQDFKCDKDTSVQKLIADVVKAGEYVGGRDGTYEGRVLRITVLERLYPITSLRKGKYCAQVFVDILQCPKWLYEHAKILHRDISMANIMFRTDGKRIIFEVLNDFDLSSLLLLEKATSLPRMGTPPYMAFDLLKEEKDSGPHLYRHDLEALFYVMLMICCRHSIIKQVQPDSTSQLEEISANFSEWFDREMSWNMLATVKKSFFTDDEPHPVSRCFEGFRHCLDVIRSQFSAGIFAKKKPLTWSLMALPDDINLEGCAPLELKPQEPVQPFDEDDTLGGHIHYGIFLMVMRIFKNNELIVRNRDRPLAAAPS